MLRGNTVQTTTLEKPVKICLALSQIAAAKKLRGLAFAVQTLGAGEE